jgi:hypothetical protein
MNIFGIKNNKKISPIGVTSESSSNEIDPLSKKKRGIYLALFGVLFVLFIPILIFYATGYRITSALNLVRTGGLYVSIPSSGSDVFLENKIVKQSGFFSKNVFVQNLRPNRYEVRVEKEGYQTWYKTLQVFPKTVTEGYPFLLKNNPTLTLISEFPTPNDLLVATGTKIKTATTTKQTDQYKEVATLFAPISATSTASTSDFKKNRRNLLVENKKGILQVSWTGDRESIPHYFCEYENCKLKILIDVDATIKTFDFFPGRDDLIIYGTQNGIFVTEIDDRSKQNINNILVGSGLDFRIKDSDTIYIKKDGSYFSVSF